MRKNAFSRILVIVLSNLILSCENPMVGAILPDIYDRINKDNSYAVAFNANGGAGEMKPIIFRTGVWNNLPSNIFTRESHIFTGWALTANGNAEYADKAAVRDITAPGETVTLYAKWGSNVYIVAYNANGGEGHMPPDIFTLGEPRALAANAFSREGYIFAGWSAAEDGEIEYADNAQAQELSGIAGETVTLYALWKGITYTIEYNASGGEGEMGSSEFTYDKPQELKPNAFVLDGYVFAGWSTTEEGEVEYANEESILNLTGAQGDKITLYAIWE